MRTLLARRTERYMSVRTQGRKKRAWGKTGQQVKKSLKQDYERVVEFWYRTHKVHLIELKREKAPVSAKNYKSFS